MCHTVRAFKHAFNPHVSTTADASSSQVLHVGMLWVCIRTAYCYCNIRVYHPMGLERPAMIDAWHVIAVPGCDVCPQLRSCPPAVR
jgi:hypothetical protein